MISVFVVTMQKGEKKRVKIHHHSEKLAIKQGSVSKLEGMD